MLLRTKLDDWVFDDVVLAVRLGSGKTRGSREHSGKLEQRYRRIAHFAFYKHMR
jgi:hypothetical protein